MDISFGWYYIFITDHRNVHYFLFHSKFENLVKIGKIILKIQLNIRKLALLWSPMGLIIIVSMLVNQTKQNILFSHLNMFSLLEFQILQPSLNLKFLKLWFWFFCSSEMGILKENQLPPKSSQRIIHSTLKIRDEGKDRIYVFEYTSSTKSKDCTQKRCHNKENPVQMLPNRLRWGRNRPVIDYYGNRNWICDNMYF